MPFVGPRPAGVNHGFAGGFDQIVLNSFQQRSATLFVERPHSKQRLIKKIFFVAVRHRAAFDLFFVFRVLFRPQFQVRLPFVG